MKILFDIVSVMVIICLLGAMLYASKALKAQKQHRDEEKKAHLKMIGLFAAGYVLMNVVRLFLESRLG